MINNARRCSATAGLCDGCERPSLLLGEPRIPPPLFFTSFVLIPIEFAQCFRSDFPDRVLALNRSTVVLIWRIKRHKPANRKNFMKHTLSRRVFRRGLFIGSDPLLLPLPPPLSLTVILADLKTTGGNSLFPHFNYQQLNSKFRKIVCHKNKIYRLFLPREKVMK